jgi:hypothetical protein
MLGQEAVNINVIVLSFTASLHTALRRKSKDWLALNQDNVSKWSDMSTCELLFQQTSTIKIQLSILKQQISMLLILVLQDRALKPLSHCRRANHYSTNADLSGLGRFFLFTQGFV